MKIIPRGVRKLTLIGGMTGKNETDVIDDGSRSRDGYRAIEPVRTGRFPASEVGERWSDWRWQWENRLETRDAADTLWRVPTRGGTAGEVAEHYPVAVTPYLLSLADAEDPADPILRQFLPDPRELMHHAWLREDPLAEEGNSPVPGLVQRYPDRGLVVFTANCAAHCRYCFRKRLWRSGDGTISEKTREGIIAYLRNVPAVREVILSGGDPLVAAAEDLLGFLSALRRLRHVEVLRVATRVPVVLPMRVTDALASDLARLGPVWITVQVNHPREITPEMSEACGRFIRRGIPVLSQTVLLRGVNDDAPTLKRLFTGLERITVKPYYLHQCDPVMGAEHFRTPVWKGMALMEELRGRIAGPAIPSFVVDCPGGGGKVPVAPPYLASDPSGDWVAFRNNRGGTFRYPNPRDDGTNDL